MSKPKTTISNANVTDFINTVPDETKRNDSFILVELFSRITGEEPKMWGPSIIGFGSYHYKSERSAQEGDWMLVGFSPRKQNLALYLMLGLGDYSGLLAELGKHKVGKGCLYINKLGEIDLAVLEKLIRQSFMAMKKKYHQG